MKRTAALLSAAFAITAIAAGSAGSATSKSSFAVLVAPTTTAASNGLTIQTEMTGSFNVAAKTASGDGTYSLMAGSTVLDSGTFTLDPRLVTFQFYGCGEVTMEGERIPLPPDFCGGRVTFGVHATSSTGAQHDGPRRTGSTGDERGRQGQRSRDQLQQTRHGRQPLADAALAGEVRPSQGAEVTVSR